MNRWRSGALLAAVTSGSSVLTYLSLRADSDGSAPGLPSLVAGSVFLALVLWPLASRAARTVTLAAVLLAAEIGTHAISVLSSGMHGTRELVCCPSADQVRPGPLGTLTANAGWWLLAAQVFAAFLLAAAHCLGRKAIDATGAALSVFFMRRLRRVVLAVPEVRAPLAPRRTPLPKTPYRAAPSLRRGPPTPALRPRPLFLLGG